MRFFFRLLETVGQLRRGLHRRASLIVLIALGALALSVASLTAVRYFPRPPLASLIPQSRTVFDVQGRLLRITLAEDEQYRVWTPLAAVSPELIDALLLQEDRRFYWHPGFNPVALVRASVRTATGGRTEGGSTLTMQLARLLYGLNTRTVRGKLAQIAHAVSLEARYSKRELLEAHLNLMPYGGNLQGVGTASLIYFNKSPRQLTLAEALTLVVIPQSPLRRDPVAGESAHLTQARLRLFEQWQATRPSARAQASSLRQPLHYGRVRDLPFNAPHYVDALLARSTVARIHATLDLGEQRALERVVAGYVREQRRVGIRNAAALLVDARDLSVRAMVGSANFFDAAIAGQVNGTLAKRSPGSMLKPFIYALAMDQGRIHPMTVLKDAPTAFGTFSPENFDGQFVGPVSAKEALVRSRNVPAVALAAQLAQPSFYQFLKTAGVARLASEQHYGLALALGGGEVTMEEAAMLYAMLANRGLLAPLRYERDDERASGTRVLSAEASFMTLDMLRDNPRPVDALTGIARDMPIAWKTGTSWGFRDAWTAGTFGHYVLVVWVGNFDGAGNPAFIGIQTAAPLFFRVADALRTRNPAFRVPLVRPPDTLTRVPVCAASGDLPNADCPQTVTTWFIPGKSPIRVSQVHKKIAVDTRTGRQACVPYDPRYVRSEVFELWPSDVMSLFARAGVPRRPLPPPAQDCVAAALEGGAPQITSPLSGAGYHLRRGNAGNAGNAGNDTIALAANTVADTRAIYWFVDETYVGSSKPGTAIPWRAEHSGSYLVRAVDDRGRAASRELTVMVLAPAARDLTSPNCRPLGEVASECGG